MDLLLIFGGVVGIGAIIYLLFGAAPVYGEGDMQRLSASAIANVASSAGFYGDNLVTAVAIALAESSGNANAHGDVTLGSGHGSFGLWQIYSDAHPEYGPDFTQLYDPQTNANAAYNIFVEAGNSFNPWSTFKNGAYRQYLDQAGQAIGG